MLNWWSWINTLSTDKLSMASHYLNDFYIKVKRLKKTIFLSFLPSELTIIVLLVSFMIILRV